MENQHNQLDSLLMLSCLRRGWLHLSHLVVFVPMLWSLSTTDRSMLVTATSVDTFTFSYTRENTAMLTNSQKQNIQLNSNSNLELEGEKRETQPYLNMIGNQTAVPSHCHGKVVIATGWLAGHEIQLKKATKSREKDV